MTYLMPEIKLKFMDETRKKMVEHFFELIANEDFYIEKDDCRIMIISIIKDFCQDIMNEYLIRYDQGADNEQNSTSSKTND